MQCGVAVGGPYQLLDMDCGEGTVNVLKVQGRNVEGISHIDLRVCGVPTRIKMSNVT